MVAQISFKNIALPLAMMGVPVCRLQPISKVPMEKSWQNLATTDIDKIIAWDSETPNCNCASVAKSDGVLFFETDEPGIKERFEQEAGERFQTFTVQSRPGRLHFYFTQTDESRKCGSITQKEIPFGSLRQNNAYVVSPGSIHPITKEPYVVVDDSPIIPIPTKLIEWLVAQRTKTATIASSAGEGPIPVGERDNTLTSIGGKLRAAGLNYDEIYAALSRINEERCKPPLSDDDVKRIAKSVSRYDAENQGPTVTIGGKIPGQTVAASYAHANSVQAPISNLELIPAGTFKNPTKVATSLAEYPLWVWEGTIYEEFAEVCGKDNFISKEFFLEAIKTVVGAMCGHRIQPAGVGSGQPARWYTILIGPGGKGKSQAVKWATELFIGTGLFCESGQTGGYTNIGCARGSFASASAMKDKGFRNHPRILQIYDEITSVIEKFSIVGSGGSFLDTNNQLFEYTPQYPSFLTKDDKQPMPNREVHNSILGCTTPLRWQNAFGKTSADGSGFFQRLNVISNPNKRRVRELLSPDFTSLRDQFVRKIQPLEFQIVRVSRTEDATALLDAWLKQKEAEWENLPDDIKGRIELMIARNISHLSWLMSGEQIADPDKNGEPIDVICDEDIVKRALALVEYQITVRQLHKPNVADNPYALMENNIERYFVGNGGQSVTRRTLFRDLNASRYGNKIFDQCLSTLVQEGLIKMGTLENETKRGRKANIIQWIGEEE
jgi:hypothetical protein